MQVNKLAQHFILSYSSLMDKELKDQRVAVMLTPSELEEIDEWAFHHRIRSRGEAMRILMRAGLIFPGLAEDMLHQVTQAYPTPHPEVTITGSEIESAINKYRAELPKRK